jgi:hypothetical protein
VTAAIRFGFVPDAPAGEDRANAALNAIIEQRLQLVEVNRYAPPEPSEAEIEPGSPGPCTIPSRAPR